MYPKTIKLENPKLLKLLTEKGELIKEGIQHSISMEEIEKEMDLIDNKVKELEKEVDITDLTDREKVISEKVQACIDEMNAVKDEIYKRMNEKVDHTLHEEYDLLKNRKAKAEEDRNKIALKAQKYNDKIIPLGRKLMAPFLTEEYDDYETIQIEEGEIVATVFNHLNDFKTNFKQK